MPKLPKLGALVARRLSVRILVASLPVMVALAVGVAITSGLSKIDSIRHDAHALSSQLASSMQFFDYTPMVGTLNAFTQGRGLHGAVILDMNGQVVCSNLRARIDWHQQMTFSSGRETQHYKLEFHQGLPTVWLASLIKTPADLPLGRMIVAVPLGPVVQQVALAVLIFAAFAAMMLLWIARTVRAEVTKSLGSIAELTNAFTHTASLDQLPSVAVDPGSMEVKSLVDAYEQMMATVRHATAMEADLQRDSIVAQTTQMLAHDVRKPFSILTMGLKSLSMASDADQLRGIVGRMIPEVDRALTSVNGMITDIMEIGADSSQNLHDPISPNALIEASLGDLFRLFPESKVDLSYDLHHSFMVDIDSQKVLRVFLNILSNAMQAMNQHGHIWFSTRDVIEDHRQFVEFILGNNGPAIDHETLAKLFNAFYTKGKRGGTGLGLAIVQKVIRAHGGRITCNSSDHDEGRSARVEFVFTLPVRTGSPNLTSATLPASSQEFATDPVALRPLKTPSETSFNHSERDLEALICDVSQSLDRPLRVLVVDDEAIYRNALAAFFTIGTGSPKVIELHLAEHSDKALALVRAHRFDLIITDVDLGPSSLDGFELVAAIQDLLTLASHSALICIHSNRIVAADHKAAAACGAHAFLPKPMARAQLLRLLMQATEDPLIAVAKRQQGAHKPPTAEIIIVEDNIFMLESWEQSFRHQAKVHALDSPEAFDAKLAEDPTILSRISCLVTDYHFDNSPRTGIDLGRRAKAIHPELLVLLVTDATLPPQALDGAVDRMIAKHELDIKKLAG